MGFLQDYGLIIGLIIVIIFAILYSGKWRESLRMPGRMGSGDSSSRLVVFHMPWCGYCKQLLDGPHSVWNQLKRKHAHNSRFIIAEVNCETNPENARKYDIDGYPTIIKIRGSNATKYDGPRTLAALDAFLTGAQ